ncbi:MAG: GAF domain-containing protein, partial [Chloroflexi bacterium]|nr:GAF domain-containing protein [Chloroflexota bacterium]
MSAPLAATAHGSDAEYRAIFEASSDGLVVNDLDTGIVLAANPAFCRMHGYDQMAGLHPSIFIHPSSLPLFGAFMRAVRAGEEFRCQAQDVRQDGTLVDVEVLGRTFTYRGKPATLGVVRDVTERVRAYEVLEQRVAERTREIEHRKEVAESMRELLAVVNSRRPLDQVLDDVLRQAARLLGTDAEMLYLVDERDPSVLRLQASRNLPPGGAPPSVARGTPTIGLAADRGLPVVAADLPLLLAEPSVATVDEQVHDRGAYLELVSRGPASAGDPLGQRGQGGIADLFGSAVAVPMVARGTCYGSLLLAHRERRVPSDDELGLIAAFASQAGLAIESARLQEQADRRLRELEALYEADGEMHSSLRLDDVLQALADVAASMLRGDKTSVLMWDAQHTRLTVHAAHGFAPETIALMSFAPGEGISARVAASGEPIAVYDVRADPRIPPRIQAINEAAAICSLVSVPIKLSGQVFGVFNVNCTERRTFSSDEQRVLAALAQRAAQAIQNARFYQQAQHTAAENARLHDEAERQRLELAALYHADEALHRSLRLDQVLLTLVDAAIALLNADGGGLWGPDPRPGGGVVPLAARGISADYLRQTVILIEDPTVRDWWAQETLAVEDVARHPGFPPASRQALEDEGYRAILNTTVRVGDQVFGTFSIGWRKPHTFSESEQRLFTALGQRAGLAIHNARLHEESERQRQELEAL